MGNCNCVSDQKGSRNGFKCPSSLANHSQLESFTTDIGVNSHRLPLVIGAQTQLPIEGDPEDMFFDSCAWLESDCEDFASVGCDFTPSLGATPIHASFREPTVKKQLIELLCESFRSDHAADAVPLKLGIQEKIEAKLIALLMSPDVTNASPCKQEPIESPSNSPREKSLCSYPDSAKEKKPISNCLPTLLRSLSSGKKKKRLTHEFGDGD